MREPRPCPVCDEVFEPYKVGGYWTKTCGARACKSELIARAMRAGGAKKASAASATVRAKPKILLTCEICHHSWTVLASQSKNRRTCSIACAAELKRRRGGDARKGEKNPNWRGGSRKDVRDRAGERLWYANPGTACVSCGALWGDRAERALNRHHAVYRQHVRREGGDEWDARNAVTLCTSCHSSHHHRGRVLPLVLLPDSVYAFACELMGAAAYDYLRRRYAGEDPRLERILRREHPPLEAT
jgi:5-methylcytosine-specific restriction endonuclease McrA